MFEFKIHIALNLSPVNIHIDYVEEFGRIINVSNYLLSNNKPNDTKKESNDILEFMKNNFIITKNNDDHISKDGLKKWFKIVKQK